MGKIRTPLPIAFRELRHPHRYKVFYGGRGSAKSTSAATMLVARAAERPIRILCAREFMSSIRDSVHQLLSDRIEALGVADQFVVEHTSIRHRNGSEFIFAGLRHNVSRIKSMEAISICWVEEAVNVSHTSLETLIPTIRAPGSELWFTFNPVLETDAVYTRFITNPPADSVVQHVTWKDNPWFPPELAKESAELKERDFDAWIHVYGGRCRTSLDGAIYARELREAEEAERIRSVPYDPAKPVNVYCDIGWADNTSLLFVQHIAGEVRIIDAHQDSGRAWPHYLLLLQQRGYVIGTVWLPHDAQATELGTGRSIEEVTRAGGWRVRIVPKLDVADGISATRTAFPTMFFDRERCADGYKRLRRYRYEVDDNGRSAASPSRRCQPFRRRTEVYGIVAMTEKRTAIYGSLDPPACPTIRPAPAG